MCGISGLVSNAPPQANELDLKKMMDAMAYRGPDSAGSYSNGSVELGHRRLKIIDLTEAADQPLFNETKDVAVVFNGEIYNFIPLREELQKKGHRFQSRSDTEVIVHAFEEWGTNCFRRFNGIFAFALLDGRSGQRKIYLVRDRFGTKPLFYTLQNQKLAFASDLRSLLQVSWITKDIDPQSLLYFLKFSHVPTPHSLVSGIQQLEPGTWMRFENGLHHKEAYWSPMTMLPNYDNTENRSEQEWLELLSATLQSVVQKQMVSDVPVGCFLSGGVDSTLLVMAHSALKLPAFDTFSIGYKESEFDETAYASRVAEIFQTRHHKITATPQDYFSIIRQLPDYFGQPLGDPTAMASLLLSRFVREKVKVVLSGDGGDELFFGYPYQHALYHLKLLLSVPASLRRGLLSLMPRLGGITHSTALQRLDKAIEILRARNNSEFIQSFIGTIGPLPFDRIAGLINAPTKPISPLYSPLLRELEKTEWKDAIQQIFLRTFLTDTVLAKTDRTTMAFGLEARVPFLDDEMVEFSKRLPFHLKYRHGKGKYLLRKLMAQRLPRELSQRPKQGFSIPLRDWLRGDLRYLLDEYLNPERIRKEEVLNAEAITGLVQDHLKNRANHSHLLWSLISFQMWKERYSL